MTTHLIAHSSNEVYGADRVVIDVLRSAPSRILTDAIVWLPEDTPAGQYRLDQHLEEAGIKWALCPLPIIRRSYVNAVGLSRLIVRCFRVYFLLKRVRPASVYCTTSACLLIALLARLVRTPEVVLHVQEVWSGRQARVLGVIARNCTRILAVSEAVSNSLPKHLSDRTTVIPNCTGRPTNIGPLCAGRSIRFLMAGRWNRVKGYETLLKAWDTEERLGHLTILGGPPPSGRSVDVPGIVSSLHNPDSVSLVGEVGDISPYINSTDVMIVPSDGEEAFGLVAIEAFSHGRPVIASASGGLVEIVEDGHTGWVFPKGEWKSLRACLDNVTEAEVRKRGLAAKEAYETRFSQSAFRRRMRSVWSSLA